jgi:RNA polymerase sigma-70 factor (ECF subfamily)
MTGDPEEALDIVQDAMFRFVRKYSARPDEEWRPLFFRILVNRSRDYRRRMAVRSRLMTWFRSDDDPDPVEVAPGPRTQNPEVQLNGRESMAVLEEALEHLPARQRETFVLRCLEGLSVADTAWAMGCSEGSVKTHYSRALTVLREKLGDYYDG